MENTPYELWKKKRPNIYFHSFGYSCFIFNTKDQIGKLDSKVHKGIFLGYSDTSNAYKVYNSHTLVVEETINIKI